MRRRRRPNDELIRDRIAYHERAIKALRLTPVIIGSLQPTGVRHTSCRHCGQDIEGLTP